MDDRFAVRLKNMLAQTEVPPVLLDGMVGRLADFATPYAVLVSNAAQQQHLREYLAGLLSRLERKTGEAIAYLHGYLGENAVRPFIDAGRATGRGVFVLVRPSDPGADEVHEFGGAARFYEHMARLVHRWGAADGLMGNCGLSCVGAVVAPKDAASTAALRAALPHTPFLVPGYGAQGATAESCRPCFRGDGRGAIINASRSVIYAFSRPEHRQQSGADWPAAVAAACRAFASDVARLLAT